MSGNYAFLGNERVGACVERGMTDAGWQVTDDIADADAVFTYFTYIGALEDAYFETDGLVKRAIEGTLLVDLSPATASFSRELSAVATVNDLRFVEAPLVVLDPSRTDALAAENMECFLAGDDEDTLDEAEGLVKLFAAHVERVGICGMAQLAKSACTSQIAAQMLAAVESAALYGTEGALAHDATVPACSPMAKRMLEAVSEDRFEGNYTVEMLMGDVVAAATAADDAGLILPQLEATLHLLEVLAVIGGTDMSPTALSLLYRDEQASADNGLDWTRAEGLFHDDDPGHHDHDHGGFGGFDDYDEDGPLGFANGFGGYSTN